MAAHLDRSVCSFCNCPRLTPAAFAILSYALSNAAHQGRYGCPLRQACLQLLQQPPTHTCSIYNFVLSTIKCSTSRVLWLPTRTGMFAASATAPNSHLRYLTTVRLVWNCLKTRSACQMLYQVIVLHSDISVSASAIALDCPCSTCLSAWCHTKCSV